MIKGSSANKISYFPETTDTVTHPKPVMDNYDNEDDFFVDLFKNYPGKFDSILAHRKDWNVQVVYTEINRGRNGIPQFQHHYFNKRITRYFYPASSLSLPLALLSLQKLNELKIQGVDRNSTMITETANPVQTPVFNDPNTPDGKPSVSQYIKRMLLGGDNDAFNRLYEFCGQEYINTALSQKGYKSAQVLQRLGLSLTEDENRQTNPVNFYNNNRIIYSQPLQMNTKAYQPRMDSAGTGYYSDGAFVNRPMDFSKKNRISLEDLHNILISVIFPAQLKEPARFNITDDDRKFVLKYMSAFPGESVYPFYDTAVNHDTYSKYIFYGSGKGAVSKNIRSFNNSGIAYGQITDVAYIVDLEKKIEFIVSATIYCNADGILNDDKYEYNTIGLPFMKDIGKALYDYESKRARITVPDLSYLMFSYDK
jgi:hypothetical protein